ncbi:MAG: ubiquinol-cytochrome c reductase iron-sulfur subunit [Actinomycetota bacterium]
MLAISQSTFAIIVVGALFGLFLLLLAGSFVRARQAAAAGKGGPAAPAGPKPISRRDFFRAGLLYSFSIFLAQFGGATLAFLYPNLKGGFGSQINAGSLSEIKNAIQSTRQPFYLGAGRFYLVAYEVDPLPEEYVGVAGGGLMALYQRCVHLGCRVPFCEQSQWFECPCHGSKYNRAGEYEDGPAPKGLDRFPVIVSGDTVTVDTSQLKPGPTRGTDTIKQQPEGPFCVGSG